MKKIIFDCERMKYPDTGLYHYCLNLGLHLQKATAHTSNEQIVFYTPPKRKGLFGPEATYLTQHSPHKYFLPSLRTFAVWHATFQGSQYLPIRDTRIKVVLTIHDLNYLYDEGKSEEKRKRYTQELQKLINLSDALVCISKYCQKDVLAHCTLHTQSIHTIYNGCNTMQKAILTASSYQPTKPYVFSVGTVNRKKNCHVLLPLLQNNDLELLIAGKYDDPEYITMFEKYAVSLGVQDRVHLLGAVSENEKAWYYENCLAFLFPSLSEGFGLPVIEAMHYGKPVFLSDRTALPEIGGDVSFYFRDFSPAAMQHVFAEGMKQYQSQSMQTAIQARAASFDWDKAAAEYLAVYRSLY